jgi:hypothetical protein
VLTVCGEAQRFRAVGVEAFHPGSEAFGVHELTRAGAALYLQSAGIFGVGGFEGGERGGETRGHDTAHLRGSRAPAQTRSCTGPFRFQKLPRGGVAN